MAKKEFTFHGKNREELMDMSINEFKELIPSNLRRSINRGFTFPEKSLLNSIKRGKEKLKTHAREMVILPLMIGKTIGIHNGKEYVNILITEEMLGHRLGELTYNRKRIQHSAPGIGATKSTGSVSVK